MPAAERHGVSESSTGLHVRVPARSLQPPGISTEWWYYTGNLRAADGRRFGYELTFFRHGVDRSNGDRSSVWDVGTSGWHTSRSATSTAGMFHHAERINRSGAGQAGVGREPGSSLERQLERAVELDPRASPRFNEQRLTALANGFRVDLRFRNGKAAGRSRHERRIAKSGGSGASIPLRLVDTRC